MTQFKVNDKVTVKAGHKFLSDLVFDYLTINKISGDMYGFTAYHAGKVVGLGDQYGGDHLELYVAPVITWDTLKWKDVVVRYGNEQMVLGLLNDLVFLSGCDEFNGTEDWYHKQELQNDGFTIKQVSVDKLELTLEQVAEK